GLVLDELTPGEHPDTGSDLHDLLNRALRIIDAQARRQNVSARLTLDAAPAVVQGVGIRLKQVFINLLTNAIEAMPDGGTLSVALTVDPGARRALITVTDTGRGVRPDVLPRIFDRYFTTKSIGTGIGLALARETIE